MPACARARRPDGAAGPLRESRRDNQQRDERDQEAQQACAQQAGSDVAHDFGDADERGRDGSLPPPEIEDPGVGAHHAQTFAEPLVADAAQPGPAQ